MLDDEHFVSSIDKSNALGVIAGQPGQFNQEFELSLPNWTDIRDIVLAGMGGSALAGEFTRSWLSDRLPLPFTVVRDYRLPMFVGPHTLTIISSYSGNTEETLSALDQALKAKAKVVVMCSGGQLKDIAEAKRLPLLLVPGGLQPRMAVFYGVKALASLLERLEILHGLGGELQKAGDWAAGLTGEWGMDSPTASNRAKQIANELFGSGVVMYAGPTMAAVSLKWKINFNENSKNLAWYYGWPEFSHNEMLSWSNPRERNMKVVQLRSNLDHPQVAKRFEITSRLLSGKMPDPLVVDAEGGTRLQQLLWTQLLGDFASIYLAVLNKADPLDIVMIEKLKKELA